MSREKGAGQDQRAGSDRQKGRRTEIIRAALESFGKKGFHETRIEEVAVAAGIGKGTVYEYFRSKEELLTAAVQFEMDEMVSLIMAAMAAKTTVKEKLMALVETIMVRHLQDCTGGHKMNIVDFTGSIKADMKKIAVAQTEVWHGLLEEILHQGVAAGEIREVDTTLFLGALMGAVMNIIRPWSNSMWDSYTPGEVAAKVTNFFFEGIRQR